MAITSDITKLEKRLQTLSKTRNCPVCRVRVETCATCGARIGMTPADMEATDRKLTDLLNGMRVRQGLDPLPYSGFVARPTVPGTDVASSS